MGEARKRYQSVIESALSVNFKRGLQYTYNRIGNVSFSMADYREAEDYFLSSLGISDEIGVTIELLASFYDIARVHASTGQENSAVEMLAVILKQPAAYQHALFRQATVAEMAEALRSELESRLDTETYAAAWKRGTERELQSVVDEVLAGDSPF